MCLGFLLWSGLQRGPGSKPSDVGDVERLQRHKVKHWSAILLFSIKQTSDIYDVINAFFCTILLCFELSLQVDFLITFISSFSARLYEKILPRRCCCNQSRRKISRIRFVMNFLLWRIIFWTIWWKIYRKILPNSFAMMPTCWSSQIAEVVLAPEVESKRYRTRKNWPQMFTRLNIDSTRRVLFTFSCTEGRIIG